MFVLFNDIDVTASLKKTYCQALANGASIFVVS